MEPFDSAHESVFFDDEFEQESEQDTKEALIAGQRGFVSDVVAEAFAELGIDSQYPNTGEVGYELVAEVDPEPEREPDPEIAGSNKIELVTTVEAFDGVSVQSEPDPTQNVEKFAQTDESDSVEDDSQ